MKRKLFIPLLVLFAIAIGCNKKDSQEINNNPLEIGEIKNHVVNYTQAQTIAVLHSIYPEQLKVSFNKKSGTSLLSSNTISAQIPKIQKSVKSTFSVREGQVNPTAFVINYKEGGFIIISGDDRMVPILAHSDKGSFEMTEISKLPGGVSHWFSDNHNFIADLRSGKVKNEQKKADQIKSLWKELEYKKELKNGGLSVLTVPTCGELTVGLEYTIVEENGPLISTNWSQGAGYNANITPAVPDGPCDASLNYRALVGCVGVSIAQIMYYHQYPSTYDWSSMSTYAPRPETARLMYDAAEAVNTNYRCSGSGAQTDDTDDALHGFGYSSALFGTYNFSMVKTNILAGLPVILGANYNWGGSGHQWIAHGVKFNQTLVCSVINDGPPGGGGGQSSVKIGGTSTKTVPGPQYAWVPTWFGFDELYMNWGWGIIDDGWYSAYAWSPSSGHNYQYAPEMVYGIHP